MTFDDLKSNLEAAAAAGTLMTSKHDPGQLSATQKGFRSVLSYELANNLENFISSGGYKVTEYENKRFPATPLYFVIEPHFGSGFSVPASGVPPLSPSPTTALDRLVAVSGGSQGWHIFGANNTSIQKDVASGYLSFKASL